MKKLLLAFVAVGALSVAQAQTTVQFPTTPWSGYAPAFTQCGLLKGANFNSTADQPIYISVPSGAYMIDEISISGASVSLTTAQGGFYTAASKGGVAVVANSQAYSTLTTNTVNTTGNAMLATLSTAGNTTEFGGYGQTTNQISVLYFSLTTAQGAAATANIRVRCRLQYG